MRSNGSEIKRDEMIWLENSIRLFDLVAQAAFCRHNVSKSIWIQRECTFSNHCVSQPLCADLKRRSSVKTFELFDNSMANKWWYYFMVWLWNSHKLQFIASRKFYCRFIFIPVKACGDFTFFIIVRQSELEKRLKWIQLIAAITLIAYAAKPQFHGEFINLHQTNTI